MREIWKRPADSLGLRYKAMLMDMRRQSIITRVDKPTRMDRARSLGYKAKTGHVVVRIKIGKGMRKTPNKGRRSPKASGRFFSPGTPHQAIAEKRVARKYPNMEVMNSYMVAEDGMSKWYEVLLLDPHKSEVSKDPERKGIVNKSQRGRAFRGKTSIARKSRGLTKKGKGAEKIRPSIRAKGGKAK